MRLVKSASRLISNEKIKQLKEKRNTPEGKLDKNGKPKKFNRDLESNSTIKNDELFYGLKEHASIDTNHGFILTTILSPAFEHDTNYLQYCTLYSRHTKQPIKKVYADKAYFGEPNRDFLALNKIDDGIMRKDTTTAKLTDYEKERNKKISKVRYIACPVEFPKGDALRIPPGKNSTSVSVTSVITLKKQDLLKLLKTRLTAGAVKQPLISQGG